MRHRRWASAAAAAAVLAGCGLTTQPSPLPERSGTAPTVRVDAPVVATGQDRAVAAPDGPVEAPVAAHPGTTVPAQAGTAHDHEHRAEAVEPVEVGTVLHPTDPAITPLPVPADPTEPARDLPADTVLAGTIHQLVGETFTADGQVSASTRTTVVETEAGELQVSTDDFGHVPTASQVQLTLAGEQLESLEVTAAPPPAPATALPPEGSVLPYWEESAPQARHAVTLVMVEPPGTTMQAGVTYDGVRHLIDNQVSQYWSDVSQQQIQLRVVSPQRWLRTENGCSNPVAMWREAAASAGWSRASKSHLVVFLPRQAPGCHAGLAEVGGLTTGGMSYIGGYVQADIVAHELGHNIGFGHSNVVKCTTQDATFSGTWPSHCQAETYRDYYDVMGASWGNARGPLNAAHAQRLSPYIGASHVVVPRSDPGVPSRVVLTSYGSWETQRAAQFSVDGQGSYFLEYRSATGLDRYLSSAPLGLETGVLVHRQLPDDTRNTYLLDATPSPRTGWHTDHQYALAPGQTFTATGGVTITVVGWTATEAVVDVTFG